MCFNQILCISNILKLNDNEIKENEMNDNFTMIHFKILLHAVANLSKLMQEQ